jgi:hypothetical protein
LRPNGEPKLVRSVTMGNGTLFGRHHHAVAANVTEARSGAPASAP